MGQPASIARTREKDPRLRRARLNSVALLVNRATTMAAALLTVPLALDYLGPERYGMWVTLSSLFALTALADLGIGYGLMNAVVRDIGRGDTKSARVTVSSGSVVLAFIALGGIALTVISAFVVPWSDILNVQSPKAREEAALSVTLFLVLAFAIVPLGVASQVRIARQQAFIPHALGIAGGGLGILLLLVAMDRGAGVPVLVIAMAGPNVLLLLLHTVYSAARRSPWFSPTPRLANRRVAMSLARSGLTFAVIQVAAAVAFATDSLVLAHILGPEVVAEYAVVLRLFQVPMGLAAIAATPLWPAYGDAISRGELRWVRRTILESLQTALVITVPAAVLLVAVGGEIARAWSGGVASAPIGLLVPFAAWTILGAVGHSTAMFLNGADQLRLQALWAVAMAIVNLGLSIWLTPLLGIAGVVWGTVLAYSVGVLLPMSLYVPPLVTRLERDALAVQEASV